VHGSMHTHRLVISRVRHAERPPAQLAISFEGPPLVTFLRYWLGISLLQEDSVQIESPGTGFLRSQASRLRHWP
jgi:hypothetical protein